MGWNNANLFSLLQNISGRSLCKVNLSRSGPLRLIPAKLWGLPFTDLGVLADRPGKERAVEYFYWDSVCDRRTSLGVWRDNFRCHFFRLHVNSWGCPEGCPTYTGKESWKKKRWIFFFFFFFVLRSGEEEENSCFTSSRQPVDHILANHAACCICDTLSCGDFCSRRRQRCWQSPEVIWEQQDSGAQLQRLPRFFWAWQGLREWRQRAAEAVFLRHAIALMLFWWERGIVVNEMAVWPGGTGRFFYLQHAQKLKKPNPPKVPGSVLCVGGNAVKQQNTELFSNYFPPDGNTSVILSQGNPVFPQQLLQ